MTRPLRVSAGVPVVVDSSVVFKWFDATEPGSDVAEELLDAHGRDDIALVVPTHLPLEVVNAHAGRRASLQRMIEAVADLTTADLIVAPVDNALLIDAARIASVERIALYDAAFIALAAQLDAELVTADRRQASTSACKVRLIG